MNRDDHPPASGPGRPLAEIALSSITVHLGLLEVLGPAFLRRHEALPYEVTGQTLRLVTPHPDDSLLLDADALASDALALLPLVLILAIVLTHLGFYRYVAGKRNIAFAIAVVPAHLVFFLCCAVSIPIALAKHYSGSS